MLGHRHLWQCLAQAGIAWLLTCPAVSSVIIGACTVEQLRQNLKAVEVKFTTEELEQIDRVSKPSPRYPQWMMEMSLDAWKKAEVEKRSSTE